MSYLFTNNTRMGFEDGAVDSFGKLKTVSPFTIFDSQHRYRDNGKWSTLVVEGGTTEHDPDESAVILSIGRTAGSSVIRETRRVFPYQPGKSLLSINTFAMNSGKSNLTQRVGMFGQRDGVYLEQSGFPYGQNLYFVLRSSVSGSVQETRVEQSQWNGDSLDGSGPSGISLDVTKANIMWSDVEWLGAGSVRCGFYFEGRPVIAHTFHNANKNLSTYMTTATLPVRYEIFNHPTNAAASGSSMRQICSTVISEGGYQGRSTRRSVGVGLTSAADMKTLSASGTYYPVLSVRLKSNRLDSVVVPSQLNIISGAKGPYHFRLLVNATLANPVWGSVGSDSAVEWDRSATAVSGGEEISSGIFNDVTNVILSDITDFNYQLGRSVGGTADTLTLAVSCHQPGKDLSAEIGWEELV